MVRQGHAWAVFRLIGKGVPGFQFVLPGSDPKENLSWAVFGWDAWQNQFVQAEHSWPMNDPVLSMRAGQALIAFEAGNGGGPCYAACRVSCWRRGPCYAACQGGARE